MERARKHSVATRPGKGRRHRERDRRAVRVCADLGARVLVGLSRRGGRVVLTIGKIGKAKAQQRYYENSVAKSREDYYAGSGEAPGEFFGSGARARGLAGQTSMEHLERLFAGQDPATGE